MADKKTKKSEPQDRGSSSVQELQSELRGSLDKRAKLVFQHNVAPLKNPMELRNVRREIARLKTLIRSKEAAK